MSHTTKVLKEIFNPDPPNMVSVPTETLLCETDIQMHGLYEHGTLSHKNSFKLTTMRIYGTEDREITRVTMSGSQSDVDVTYLFDPDELAYFLE